VKKTGYHVALSRRRKLVKLMLKFSLNCRIHFSEILCRISGPLIIPTFLADTLSRNVGNKLPNDAAQHPRRSNTCATRQQEFKISQNTLLNCRGVFRPRQTRQLPRAVDLKGRLLSCQSY